MLKSICKIYITLIFFLFCSIPAHAMEYFENFTSTITVNPDASLSIEENITVHHEGIKIRRGITKILPTNKGESYQIQQVLRNGNQEPWFIDNKGNMLVLNTGDDTFLPSPGVSVYTIRYTMYDALRRVFNKPYNELYLNLTSHGIFPIKEMHVSINYPKGTDIISQYGYINRDTKQNYTPGSSFEFFDLAPGDEATVAQIFSRGTVNVTIPKIWRVLSFALLVTLLYYILAWYFVGRDPTPRAIVPDWEIPQGLSALDCAYIINDGKTPKNSFFIHILWLIYQKAISIREVQKGKFIKTKGFEITPLPDADKTNPEIKMFFSKFPRGATLYEKEPNSKIAGYTDKLIRQCAEKMEKNYYRKRNFYTFLGALFLPLSWLFLFPQGYPLIIFGLALVCVLYHSAIEFTFGCIIVTLFYISFIGIFMYPLILYANIANPWVLAVLIPYISIILIFKYLLFQPTILGQRNKEKIAGLKMFLKTINGSNIEQKNTIRNKNDIDMSMEKRLTPEDMENLFPYAVALGLEKAWERKFKAIFGTENWQNFVANNAYYTDNFTNCLNHITKSVSTYPVSHSHSSSPFSSGSGGFGGGFGGGGFGGGGFGGR